MIVVVHFIQVVEHPRRKRKTVDKFNQAHIRTYVSQLLRLTEKQSSCGQRNESGGTQPTSRQKACSRAG